MKKLNLNLIDTIIFDLGKVIINLDMDETFRQLSLIYGDDYENVILQLNEQGVFTDYETGRISTTEFVNALESYATKQLDAKDSIKKAWNAMLGDIPDVRFKILLDAKSRFQTYCLSNTNELHIEWIEDWLKKNKQLDTLDPFFHKVYYSHLMGQRKPDVEIFETLIHNHQLNPSSTLFIDDTQGHLVGAEKAGLQTHHLSPKETLEDIYEMT